MKDYKQLWRWLFHWLFTKLSLFQKYIKMISVTLSKQHALDVDAKGIMQIGFARNLDKPGNLPMFSFIKKSKETTWGFFQGTVRVL